MSFSPYSKRDSLRLSWYRKNWRLFQSFLASKSTKIAFEDFKFIIHNLLSLTECNRCLHVWLSLLHRPLVMKGHVISSVFILNGCLAIHQQCLLCLLAFKFGIPCYPEPYFTLSDSNRAPEWTFIHAQIIMVHQVCCMYPRDSVQEILSKCGFIAFLR